jgi:hypothetical protein
LKVDRIPFQEAIEDKLLLKNAFAELSPPQATALRIFYGLPLDEEGLRFWSLFQEGARYDDLGYPIDVTPVPYSPKEYDYLVGILGRRSGKTDKIASFIAAYESALGGHADYVGLRQQCSVFFVAQKLEFAEQHIQEFVVPVLESSPIIKKMIESTLNGRVLLKNKISISPAPPKIGAFRGPKIPVVVMDEMAFWYTADDAANPDYEVERAVQYAMGQFPFRKKVGISTPWGKEGILWEAHNAGTDGSKLMLDEKKKKFKNVLVLHAPTPAMQNPLLRKDWFEHELARDPEAYYREILARFVDSIAGMFPEALLRPAVARGTLSRLPLPQKPTDIRPVYVAALDPAFRRDAFGFTIVHYEGGKIVQDVVRRWKAPSPKIPLNPSIVLDEVKELIAAYHVTTVLSDQYQLESLQQLALARGFVIYGVDFTPRSKAKMYGDLLQLLRQEKLSLLDDDETFHELLALQKKIMSGGNIHISAPVGKHDDMCSVLALAASQAITYRESTPVLASATEPSLFDKVQKQIRRNQLDEKKFTQDTW